MNKITKLIIGIMIAILLCSTYTVNAVNKNNNPLLIDIIVNGESLDSQFGQFITDYVLAVESDEEKVSIEAVTDDANATYEIIGDTNLKVGINDFEIKVTAEDDETTKSYFLHITRGDKNKANVNLKNIEIEGLELNPRFNSKDTSYLVEYEGIIDKLNINATPENENSKVEILNNDNFSGTIHEVTIKVTAEDGVTTKEYKITVKRVDESVESSNEIKEHENETEQSNQQSEINEEKNENYTIIIVTIIVVLLIAIIIITRKK